MLLLTTLLALALAAGVTVYSSLQSKIGQRLEKGWVLPPLELYSQGLALSLGRRVNLPSLQAEIERRDLVAERDYFLGPVDTCKTASPEVEFPETSVTCLMLKREPDGPTLITWDESQGVTGIWRGQPWAETASVALFPRLITQFYDGQPILQKNTKLGEIPLACLQATTAIEDREFLEHSGVSATGILRALWRNVKAGKFAEGGSTITQQLVKNFFLNSKKTIRRKVEEQLLAIMLESQLSKDQILEMYLNVIYMGQSGPYQVRGFGSGSMHYFDKPVSQLNLDECALLAAIINNPGRYSPFQHPDHALQRRELVLSKMHEAGMISDADLAREKAPLPTLTPANKRPNAPYFVMTALKEFQKLGLDPEDGAKLYTSLDPELQSAVVTAAQAQLPAIEARIKKPSAQPLQMAVVTVDVSTGQVLALTGGRDFRSTQYNRAVDARRQIGSIVKPFVYWGALKDKTPLSEVVDEPFEWKNARQNWKPRNYEGKSIGSIPYFYALALSLNIPAAKVGKEVGLPEIAQTIAQAGIQEPVPQLPSLTLGAFELSPLSVAQGYLTLARFGSRAEVHTLLSVEDHAGEVLYTYRDLSEPVLDPAQTAELVSMMRPSFVIGTARSAGAAGLTGYAGKTGTTSDTKDAWFAGFNSRILTVVWVGYDDNTAMGLTGASAALPIWIELSKAARPFYSNGDFIWPEGTEEKTFTRDEILKDFPALQGLPEELKFVLPR